MRKTQGAKVIDSWNCPTCTSALSTPYCPNCGESPPSERDLTIRGFLHQSFRAFSSIDGRLLRSFRWLLTRPGALTVAYLQGRRLIYLGPFKLFLAANLLFFAVQSLTNTNIVGSTIDSHLHNQDWQTVAQHLVSNRLAKLGMTLDQYAPIFDRAIVLHAKSFIILMVLPLAMLLPILFYRNRQPFVAHAVFSLHLYAFLLLLFCTALIGVAVGVSWGGAGLESSRMDKTLSIIILAACATYLYLAMGVAYGARGAMRIIKAVVLALAVGAIFVGYRFVLFLITLYTT